MKSKVKVRSRGVFLSIGVATVDARCMEALVPTACHKALAEPTMHHAHTQICAHVGGPHQLASQHTQLNSSRRFLLS